MATPEYNPNHVSEALARMLMQYQGKPNFEALITALVGPFQELEDVFYSLLNSRLSVDNAEGQQLDLLAEIVGTSRGAADDDPALRLKIRIAIIENNSQATPENIIPLYQILVGATIVEIDDNAIGSVGFLSDIDVTQDQVNDYIPLLKAAVGAGISVEYLGSFDPVEPFSFGGPGVTPGRGFGSIYDAAVGGKWATIKVSTKKKFAFDGTDPTTGGFGTLYDSLLGGSFVGL